LNVPSNEGKRENKLSPAGTFVPVYASVFAIFRFSLSSLRGRIGQAIPVTLALLLIVGAAQAIGALGDVSSKLTRQQIATSWRASADVLVRPKAAVSQPERDAGWINPQSALDNYGGISAKQLASIASLSQVTEIVPFASVGWQRIDVVTPIVLPAKGTYRITAQWTGTQQWVENAVDYVEVSDLANLTNEEQLLHPVIQHLVLQAHAAPVVYAMSIPALQLLVGVAPSQENTVRQLLLQGSNPTSTARMTIHLDRLNGQTTMLSSCIAQFIQATCWQPVSAQTGPVSYRAQGAQLVRYSPAHYSATSQQLAAGQLTVDALGADTQGLIYRTPLPQRLMLAGDGEPAFTTGTGQQVEVLPLTGLEHMPVLPGALQLMPLVQACVVNGEQCYSGLYIRLHGVDSYNSKSLALLQATAAAITTRTGLRVDILDGSSTRVVTLASGNPNNALTATWRVVGVAVQITRGVDALQNTLFILCSIICLLAIGAAGVLIGIGRRKEARALDQLGWSQTLRVWVYIFDMLLLALPGFALSSLLIALASKFWPDNMPFSTMWALLAIGVIIYGVSLVSLAVGSSTSRRRKFWDGSQEEKYQSASGGATWAVQTPPPITTITPSPITAFHIASGMSEGGREGRWRRSRRPLSPGKHLKLRTGSTFHARITAPLVCSMAITATIFLIVLEYLMVSGFNRELVVTMLGDQVRIALEGPQLLLIVLVLLMALLTVGLCTSLLLGGRREELALLAKVGWERRHVLLRLLRESWWMAALSSVAGVLLALGVIGIAGPLPPLWVVVGVLLGGPTLGMALASLVVYTLARQELKSVYLK
jgi:hypothetical protein